MKGKNEEEYHDRGEVHQHNLRSAAEDILLMRARFIWSGFAFVPLWLKLSREGQILGTGLEIAPCFPEFPCKSLAVLISGALFPKPLHRSCW